MNLITSYGDIFRNIHAIPIVTPTASSSQGAEYIMFGGQGFYKRYHTTPVVCLRTSTVN
jgi:hypothetical protein